MLPKTAFVTGGTGFLGSFLTAFLLQKGYRVVALVRGPRPVERLYAVLHEVSNGALGETLLRERLTVVEGDIRTFGGELEKGRQETLAQEVQEIWHCATSFKFQEHDRDIAFAHNVKGTCNILDFASLCNQGAEVPLFYVSTVCAAPVTDGVAREELAPEGASYRNLYEWSKREAERLVMQFRQTRGLPTVILRPAIIIGHSQTGKAVRFTGYYGVLRALSLLVRSLEVNLGAQFDRNLRLRILARPDIQLSLVPVNFVVEAMWRVSRLGWAGRWNPSIVHIANDTAVPVANLFHLAADMLRVTGIQLAGEEAFRERSMTAVERLFHQRAQFQAPYLLDCPHFDTSSFRRLVPQEVFPCPLVEEEVLYRVNRYYLEELDRQFQRLGASRLPAGRKGRAFTVPSLLSREQRGTVLPTNSDSNQAVAA